MGSLIYEDLNYKIRGTLFEVYNTLGFGHRELVYQKSLAQEFSLRKIPFKREVHLDVIYKGVKTGLYIPDFVIDDKAILEIKSLEFVPEKLNSQLINYLKGTNFHLGFLVNFGSNKLQITRKVWGTVSV